MELDKLGLEMQEAGLQGTFGVDPKTGNFRVDVGRGNDVIFSASDPDLTEAFRKILPEGSIDRYYCGGSIEDVQTLEPTMSHDDATGVLQLMSRRADANVGFAWDTLTHYIDVYKAELARWAA